MVTPSKVIVLAAGKSIHIDGIPKILIRHPHTGKTILQHYIEAFRGKDITVVVGFRAIQIMEKYPQLNFIINQNWAMTNNAMSLALALTEDPTYVIPGDIFIEKQLINELDKRGPNIALGKRHENRKIASTHCSLKKCNIISKTYQGLIQDPRHPELLGLFKISCPRALRYWKQKSQYYDNLFSSQTLPCEYVDIEYMDLGNRLFAEINTPLDYLQLLKQGKLK